MHPVWQAIAVFILRGRIPILIVVGVLTLFMWTQRGTEIEHALGRVVPDTDVELQKHLQFKSEFGEDGNVMVMAIEADVFQLDLFNAIFDLSHQLESIEGVDQVLSITHIYDLIRNTEKESFELKRLIQRKPETQVELDSIAQRIQQLSFYKGLIIDTAEQTSLMIVSLSPDIMDTGKKVFVYDDLLSYTQPFEKAQKLDIRYAGLPVLRVNVHKTIRGELVLFLILALVVMMVTLLLFFRSISTVILPMLVVGIVIIWSIGILGLCGYKISLITGVIPALITVIGIPNSVYLITKYHIEYRRTRNKIKSLIRVIEKIGIVTIMTNATTAVGLGVLGLTQIRMLKEFGIVAGLSVVTAFFISLLLIPIFFSFFPPPSRNQVKHLERRTLNTFIRFLDRVVHHHRWSIYIITLIAAGFSVLGMSKLVPVSFMTDDIPKDNILITDLKYVEERFNGVMPFEVIVDTKKRKGALKRSNIRKASQLQEKLVEYPSISRTVSVADFTKFLRQSFFAGGSEAYALPTRSEFDFIQLYLKNTEFDGSTLNKTIVDSALQKIRITGNVRDIGSIELAKVIDSIEVQARAIFDSAKYDVTITGTTKVFVRSNDFLIKNLLQSLALAFVVIAVLMGLLFRSLRIVVISLIPNFLPLMIMAGVMGFLGIALKPSTALVFSVAFGIAVDDSIHFLARYRLAMRMGDTVPEAISNSFRDTGVSMIYTSLILFFGFVMFTASSFGGTQALGMLSSGTLIIAMFGNLLLLPALLLRFDKRKVRREIPR